MGTLADEETMSTTAIKWNIREEEEGGEGRDWVGLDHWLPFFSFLFSF
jgi:hypothetical protein